MKRKPAITKETFLMVVGLLRLQAKKDAEFADFMENYLDGRCVPTLSDYAVAATEMLLSAAFDDRETDEKDMSWIEWFIYENDYGDKKMSVKLSAWKRFRKIKSPSEMYDFMAEQMNGDK